MSTAYVQNSDDFRNGLDMPTQMAAWFPVGDTKEKKSAFLAWTFENYFNLAIDEVVVYVNSMTTAEPDSIHWTIETNAYHGVLQDKNYNTIKLETPEGENFHEFITVKFEMDPSKVDNFFECRNGLGESQIEIKIKFKPDCKNLEAARIVKWLPNAKISTEDELSCLGRILKKKSEDLPKFHFIIAIDETAQFCKSPNGSIQPKLRKAVNNLIQKLVKKLDKHQLESFGLVVVRFGGSLEDRHTYKYSSFNGHEGPFRRQTIPAREQLTWTSSYESAEAGKTVYEFAPFPDAKRSPNNNFGDYVNTLLHPDPKVSTPSPKKSIKVEEATPFLSSDEKLGETIETENVLQDVENKESYTLDFLQAQNIIQQVLDSGGLPDMIDLFVSVFRLSFIIIMSKEKCSKRLKWRLQHFLSLLKRLDTVHRWLQARDQPAI